MAGLLKSFHQQVHRSDGTWSYGEKYRQSVNHSY